MSDYNQLTGALGLLKKHGADLPWSEINEQLRDLGRRLGIAEEGDSLAGTAATGCTDPVHGEIRAMHRTYRDMCLNRKLIRCGELFDRDDCVPLV